MLIECFLLYHVFQRYIHYIGRNVLDLRHSRLHCDAHIIHPYGLFPIATVRPQSVTSSTHSLEFHLRASFVSG